MMIDEKDMWLIWFGAAIIFFVIEVLTPTFFVICMGFGCLAATIMSLIFPQEQWAHLATFAVVTFLSFLAMRPFAKSIKNSSRGGITNIQSLLDEEGIVIESIGPGRREGRIKIRDVFWRAISADNKVIGIDERVRILEIDGTKLYVELKSHSQESLS